MNRHAGFSLVEILIVSVLIAVLVSVVAPNALSAKIAANEGAAQETLRQIHRAQIESLSTNLIDTNHNGVGEFAYLAELGALVPPPNDSKPIDPPLLSVASITSGAYVDSGYVFQLWIDGNAEAPSGGDPSVSPTNINREDDFVCFAWPLDAGVTGRRVFYVAAQGSLYAFNNEAESSTAVPTTPDPESLNSIGWIATNNR